MRQAKKTRRTKLVLSEDDRRKLERLIHSGDNNARVFNRAHVLLALDDGFDNKIISGVLLTTRTTVARTLKKYLAEGLAGALYDDCRPGAPKAFRDGELEALRELANSAPPAGRSRWTGRLLTEEIGKILRKPVSRETVRQALKAEAASLAARARQGRGLGISAK